MTVSYQLHYHTVPAKKTKKKRPATKGASKKVDTTTKGTKKTRKKKKTSPTHAGKAKAKAKAKAKKDKPKAKSAKGKQPKLSFTKSTGSRKSTGLSKPLKLAPKPAPPPVRSTRRLIF